MSVLLGSSGASVILGSSGGGVIIVSEVPASGDEFNVVILGTPDFSIVASSVSGDPLTAGSFVIPTAGTYNATIQNLDGAERSIVISSGSISKGGDSNPWTVDAGDTVGDLTIVATGSNAVVTIS